MTGQRIQLSRVKGYRKPEGSIVVTRASRWGNPFRMADCIAEGWADNEADAAKVCVQAFGEWLDGETNWSNVEPSRRAWILANLPSLAGKTLACYCKPGQPCHADDLARRARGGAL